MIRVEMGRNGSIAVEEHGLSFATVHGSGHMVQGPIWGNGGKKAKIQTFNTSFAL